MPVVAVVVSLLVTYEVVAWLSRRKKREGRNDLYEEARRNRLRIMGQQGDDLWQNRSQ